MITDFNFSYSSKFNVAIVEHTFKCENDYHRNLMICIFSSENRMKNWFKENGR